MGDLASVVIGREDDAQVVRLAGEVDISNAPRLEVDISDAVPNDVAGSCSTSRTRRTSTAPASACCSNWRSGWTGGGSRSRSSCRPNP